MRGRDKPTPLVERLREMANRAADWWRVDDARLCTEAADTITELLEALIEAAEFIQPFNRAEALLDKIDAAIAKATGQ